MFDQSFFISYIQNASYLGIFFFVAIAGFFIPVPEEIMLLLIGYLAATGINNVWAVLLICLASSLTSDYIVYTASHLSSPLIKKLQKNISQQRLQKYTQRMKNHAGKTIFSLRFAVGLRFLSTFIAGSLKVSPLKFILYDSLALIIYVPTLVLLGYHFHDKITSLITSITVARHIISLIALTGTGLIVTLIVRHRFLKPNQT